MKNGGFNDFHGMLDPPTGSNGRIGDVEAGGVEFFATHLARLRSENPNTIVVSAGDNIGASSLLSGMFHDEPTVEALSNAMTGIVEGYRPFFSTLGDRDVGSITAPLLRAPVAPGPQDRFIRRP